MLIIANNLLDKTKRIKILLYDEAMKKYAMKCSNQSLIGHLVAIVRRPILLGNTHSSTGKNVSNERSFLIKEANQLVHLGKATNLTRNNGYAANCSVRNTPKRRKKPGKVQILTKIKKKIPKKVWMWN